MIDAVDARYSLRVQATIGEARLDEHVMTRNGGARKGSRCIREERSYSCCKPGVCRSGGMESTFVGLVLKFPRLPSTSRERYKW